MNLTPASQKFIVHWGEMGQAWGINRTMAQIHALLFVSPEPLDAEQISTLLDVSRSNISTSLKELSHTFGILEMEIQAPKNHLLINLAFPEILPFH